MITFENQDQTKILAGKPDKPLHLRSVEAVGNFQDFDHRLVIANAIVHGKIYTKDVHLELSNVKLPFGGSGTGVYATQSSSPKGTVGLTWQGVLVVGYDTNIQAEIDHLTTFGLRSSEAKNIGIYTGLGSMITHVNAHHYSYGIKATHPFAFHDVGMATTLISPAWEQALEDKSPAMFSMFGNYANRKPFILNPQTNNFTPNIPIYDDTKNYETKT